MGQNNSAAIPDRWQIGEAVERIQIGPRFPAVCDVVHDGVLSTLMLPGR